MGSSYDLCTQSLDPRKCSPKAATRRAPSDAGTTSAATMLSSVSPAAASTRLKLCGSCVAAPAA